MNRQYILALDQGTSSSRAVLFDKSGRVVGLEQKEFSQYYPESGWVEHDPVEIWTSQIGVVHKLLLKHKVHPKQIAGIGITNQRETVVVWDRHTGKPVYNAIVWQDRRTARFCNNLKKQGHSENIKEITGLVIDAYFSASKINWILNNVDGVKTRAENGDLLFGTIDTWLLWNLTGGKQHATDYSNASRTMLFDIKKCCWSEELLELFEIQKSMLPEVKNSSDDFGFTGDNIFENAQVPLYGVAGDQQAALFGQACFKPGTIKNTYGTGCFMLMNTGNHIVKSDKGLITTIGWGINGEITYAVEGSVFIAGAAIKWLRDGLGIINSASETDAIAREIVPSDELYVVPAFTGLGAPYWDMYARGAIIGLTQDVTDKHIVRATLDSLAYQTRDLLDMMVEESGIEIDEFSVDGGASVNNYLMQFQSDILSMDVVRSVNVEATAMGVAMLAALKTGFWTSEDIKKMKNTDRVFTSKMDEENRERLYRGWKRAVERSLNWSSERDNN
jgi:glycerol kinase